MSSAYDEAVAAIEEAWDVNEYCLFVWGKNSRDCTEHEISEALRLRATLPGEGFIPLVGEGTR